ncbi:MAG TPA: efflux RND transporter periplasmic adaptor subunit [Phycisphaerae bacterium]|nr:efflux RND transporter periplasmic adaptor subunit [Phycisphaerae bacterium]
MSSLDYTKTAAGLGSSADRPAAPASTQPVVGPSARPARRRRWGRGLMAAVIAASPLLLYIGWTRWSQADATDNTQLFTVARRSFPVILRQKGELKAANSIEIRSEVEGRATIIYLVDEGIQAKKGDLLVELASDEIDEDIRENEIRVATAKAAYEAAAKSFEILQDENASKIRKAELVLHLAQMALEKFKEGEAVEQRQEATLNLKKAEAQLEQASETLKDSESLFQEGFLTKIERDGDRLRKLTADLDRKKAQIQQEVLEKYTFPMTLQEKESDVVEAGKDLERTRKSAAAEEAKGTADVAARKSELAIVEDKLARHKDQKAKTRITAPADGLVVYSRSGSWYRSETQIDKGAQVFERQSLIELPDTRTMKIAIRVHEAQTQYLKPGLPANVEIEGFAGRQFPGKVSKIAALADSQNRWLNPNLKEYETEILLDGEFTQLKPGLTARADVLVTQLNDVLAVPVQTVFAKGASYYVFVDRGGRPEPVQITLGIASNEYLEVKGGLEVGDRAYLAITDEMKLMLPEETSELEKSFNNQAAQDSKAANNQKAKKK